MNGCGPRGGGGWGSWGADAQEIEEKNPGLQIDGNTGSTEVSLKMNGCL